MYLRYLQTPRLLISAIMHICKIKHVWKSVPLGLHNTEIALI